MSECISEVFKTTPGSGIGAITSGATMMCFVGLAMKYDEAFFFLGAFLAGFIFYALAKMAADKLLNKCIPENTSQKDKENQENFFSGSSFIVVISGAALGAIGLVGLRGSEAGYIFSEGDLCLLYAGVLALSAVIGLAVGLYKAAGQVREAASPESPLLK